MQSAGNQEDLNKITESATYLVQGYSDLSQQGKKIVGDFSQEILNDASIYKTPPSQPIYATPQKGDNKSIDDTPPSLPSSPPPSSNNQNNPQVREPNNFQQGFNSGLGMLSSNSVDERTRLAAVHQAAEVVSSPEVQERLKNDPLLLKKVQEKWNNLSDKDRALLGLAAFGAAVGAPVAIAALPILAIAGLAIAIISGLKLSTPNKEELKQSLQEVKESVEHGIKSAGHGMKNAANKLPGETNLEKLWKSAHKPGVTAENPNLEPFLTKYCFPDKDQGEKIKFDPDKIEALKAVAKEVGLDLDIDRMVRKGESKIRGDFVQSSQAQGKEDNKFIGTASEIATKVMDRDNLIKDKFKDKLAEVKQAKATEKEAKKEDSFLNKFTSKFSSSQRRSSHIENVDMNRRESSSSQNRGI